MILCSLSKHDFVAQCSNINLWNLWMFSCTLSLRQIIVWGRIRMARYYAGCAMSQPHSKWKWHHCHLAELDILMGLLVPVSGRFVFKSLLCQILMESPAPPWLATLSPPWDQIYGLLSVCFKYRHLGRCWRCITETWQVITPEQLLACSISKLWLETHHFKTMEKVRLRLQHRRNLIFRVLSKFS